MSRHIKNKDENVEKLSIYLPAGLKKKLAVTAIEDETTMSEILTGLLYEYFEVKR